MNRKQKMKVALDGLFTTSKPVEDVVTPATGANDSEPHNGKMNAVEVAPAQPVVAPETVLVEAKEPAIEMTPGSFGETRPEPALMKPDLPAKTLQVQDAIPAPAAVSKEHESTVSEAERQLVVFQLGNEQYGVDISAVDGIIKMQPITIVPHTPSYIQGVTNLRGTVLPVFDLRKRFGLEVQALTKDARIIVIRNHASTVGMIVDSVTEVLRVPEKACEPAPDIVCTVDSNYLSGIARTTDQLVILLDLDRVLHLSARTGAK